MKNGQSQALQQPSQTYCDEIPPCSTGSPQPSTQWTKYVLKHEVDEHLRAGWKRTDGPGLDGTHHGKYAEILVWPHPTGPDDELIKSLRSLKVGNSAAVRLDAVREIEKLRDRIRQLEGIVLP